MLWTLEMFVVFWEICQTALHSVHFIPLSLYFAFISTAITCHTRSTQVRLKPGYIRIGPQNVTIARFLLSGRAVVYGRKCSQHVQRQIDGSYPHYLTFSFFSFIMITHSYLCTWYQNFMLFYLYTQHVYINHRYITYRKLHCVRNEQSIFWYNQPHLKPIVSEMLNYMTSFPVFQKI